MQQKLKYICAIIVKNIQQPYLKMINGIARQIVSENVKEFQMMDAVLVLRQIHLYSYRILISFAIFPNQIL